MKIVAFASLLRSTGPVRRRPVFFAVPVALLLAAVLGIYLYDHSRRDLITPGVSVAGVNVGGLRSAAASARLTAALRSTRADWITVRDGALRFALTGSQAHLTADVDGAVQQAVSASRGGWILPRTLRDLFGGALDKRVALPVSYSHRAVDELITRIRAAIDRPARDASVAVNGSARLAAIQGHPGVAVDVSALRRELAHALRAPTSRHVLSAPVRSIKPGVTAGMLAVEYPAYIVVDRPAFKLFLYQHLRLTHTYPIAVGMAGLQTPPGLHHVLDKQVNPAWHVPDSPWAGSLAGQVIPPGPADPLVARWMGIDDQGDGIHGTNEPWSVGSAASHGCIRMLVPDVIQLYRLTPLGTPVYVV